MPTKPQYAKIRGGVEQDHEAWTTHTSTGRDTTASLLNDQLRGIWASFKEISKLRKGWSIVTTESSSKVVHPFAALISRAPGVTLHIVEALLHPQRETKRAPAVLRILSPGGQVSIFTLFSHLLSDAFQSQASRCPT